MSRTQRRPSVLIVAGLDPSGGAGLAADIQAITAAGAHPMPVASLITAQSLRRVARLETLSTDLVRAQIYTVLEDIRPAAIKLGTLGSAALARTVAEALPPDVPLVLDPVLVATSGDALGADDLPTALCEALVPRATLVTPNEDELRALGGDADADAAARLVALGARYVLVTGGATRSGQVRDRLVDASGPVAHFDADRLDGEFHGSGCTLAAACAAHLALGHSPPQAVRAAHAQVQRALAQALDFGYRVKVPDRRA